MEKEGSLERMGKVPPQYSCQMDPVFSIRLMLPAQARALGKIGQVR